MTASYLDRLGPPAPRVQAKVAPALHDWAMRFLALSPFAVLATGDADGRMDASPRGGPPGFAGVVDAGTLLLPELPGNRLLQTATNLRSSDGIGLLFLIPGVEETLRVNGRGRHVEAGGAQWPRQALRESTLTADDCWGGILVSVEEVYYHCGRAPRFAALWDPETIAAHQRQRPISKRPDPPRA